MDISTLLNSFTSLLSILLQDDQNVTYLIYAAIAIALIGALYTLRAVLHIHTKLTSSFDKDVFLILVPKEKKGCSLCSHSTKA